MERRLAALIAAAAVLVVLMTVWSAFAKRRSRAAPAADGPIVVVESTAAPAAAPTPVAPPTAGSQGAAPAPREPSYLELLARSEARRRIRASAGTTYLGEMTSVIQDSMLRRWDNRILSPVRVYVPTTSTVANFRPEFAGAVRRAFEQWATTGVPVRFALDADSASAEVVFRWKIQFEIERTGQTDLTWDQDGRVQSAVVTLAAFDPKGRPMEPDDIRVVAEHEIGHVLGLDHSADSTDLMFATAKVRELSARDAQSVLLLYQLPSGSIR